MTIKFKFRRVLGLGFAAIGFAAINGSFIDANAQTRDPFTKPGWARTKENRPGRPGVGGAKVSPAEFTGIPAVQQRIEFYKRQREAAAANGQPLPKVTSVLTLDEMAVTGIFRTPRGYAAMVEATPIQLSYTIYPGEKFFDGQLVAVEENRLVFRKVVKTGKGKFVASVENKALRQFSDREQIQGTAPVQTQEKAESAARPEQAANGEPKPVAVPVVSPLDEMNNQKSEPAKDKAKGKALKVATKR